MAKHSAALKVTEPPARSPEREKLAAAIASMAAANRRKTAAASAEGAYVGSVGRAEDAVEEAEEAVKEASKRAAKNEIARVMGEPLDDGLTPKQARDALENARETVIIAEEARRRISAEASEAANTALLWVDLRREISAVLRADHAVRAQIARFTAAMKDFNEQRAIMRLLDSAGALERSDFVIEDHNVGGNANVDRWAAAIEVLKTDPDAELPGP